MGNQAEKSIWMPLWVFIFFLIFLAFFQCIARSYTDFHPQTLQTVTSVEWELTLWFLGKNGVIKLSQWLLFLLHQSLPGSVRVRKLGPKANFGSQPAFMWPWVKDRVYIFKWLKGTKRQPSFSHLKKHVTLKSSVYNKIYQNMGHLACLRLSMVSLCYHEQN